MSGEKALVEAILAGNHNLFEKIITANNELLYRVGRSYINDHEEVEDMMQTTYLKAFEKLPQFNFRSSISTWITRIMINECLMFIRKRRGKTVPISDEMLGLNGNLPTEVQDKVWDIQHFESQLNYLELKSIIEKMISQLQEEYRLIFLLREVQKLSTKEVAGMTSLTEDNVRIRLYRAKRMLQKMLVSNIGETDIYGYDKKYCTRLTNEVMKKILIK